MSGCRSARSSRYSRASPANSASALISPPFLCICLTLANEMMAWCACCCRFRTGISTSPRSRCRGGSCARPATRSSSPPSGRAPSRPRIPGCSPASCSASSGRPRRPGSCYYELTGAPEFACDAWRGPSWIRTASTGCCCRAGTRRGCGSTSARRCCSEQVARFWRAGPAGRRDLPRRAGAGAHPRRGHRPQRPGRPADHLPAEVHGAFGLPGHRVAARPLLPHLSRLRRG